MTFLLADYRLRLTGDEINFKSRLKEFSAGTL